MSILKTLASLCLDCAHGYVSVQTQTAKAKETVDRMLSSKEKVTAEEFMQMYDLRIYDISSKQSDIKMMKNIEFEGVYILHNKSKNKYYVGKGNKIFRKIDRHFRGYGNADIYKDFQRGNKFYVRIIRLKNSGYDNIDILANEISKKYKAYETGYNKN